MKTKAKKILSAAILMSSVLLLIFGLFGIARYASHRMDSIKETMDETAISNTVRRISYATPKSRKRVPVTVLRKDAVKVYDDNFKVLACRPEPWTVENNTNETWKFVSLNKKIQFNNPPVINLVPTNILTMGIVSPGPDSELPRRNDGRFSVLLGVFVNDSTWRMVELKARPYPYPKSKNGLLNIVIDRPLTLKNLLFGPNVSYMDKLYLDGNVFRVNLMYDGKTISDSVYSEHAKKIFETILEDEMFEDEITQ